MYRGFGDDGLLFNAPMESRTPSSPTSDPTHPPQMRTVTRIAPRPSAVEAAYQYAVAAPCGAGLPDEGTGAPCLDSKWITPLALCKFGLPAPEGVSAATWTSFCSRMKQCGLDALPGCPSYDAAVAATVPACADAQYRQGLDYCSQYPLSDGPNAALNALCWSAGKSGTYMYNAYAISDCAGGSGGGASAAAGMDMKWLLVGGAAAAAALYLVMRRR